MNHTPVLLKEFLKYAEPKAGDHLLDATIGLGGHARAFLEANSDIKVTGLDADPQALEQAKENLSDFKDRVIYINTHFSNLKQSVGESAKFSHILFDLGIGSHQLDDPGRGFSFNSGAALDMLYGEIPKVPANLKSLNKLEKFLGHPPNALEIIVKLNQEDLADLIKYYGEERFSGRIARTIKESQLKTAKDLAKAISQAVPGKYAHGRIHSATRTFQALRSAVNRELESLEAVLPQAIDLLSNEGILLVISFHSLEDRLVKHFMKNSLDLIVVTKKPITAAEEEIANNPRSRSAKLRVSHRQTV